MAFSRIIALVKWYLKRNFHPIKNYQGKRLSVCFSIQTNIPYADGSKFNNWLFCPEILTYFYFLSLWFSKEEEIRRDSNFRQYKRGRKRLCFGQTDVHHYCTCLFRDKLFFPIVHYSEEMYHFSILWDWLTVTVTKPCQPRKPVQRDTEP